MRKLLTLLALIPFFLNAQSIERAFTATITFGSFSTVNDSTFRGDISVNDQTNTYTGNDIATGQIVVTSSGRSYRVDAVNSQGLFTANVDLVDIQDSNYASPAGVGQISTPTGNHRFFLFTPDNANGISQQVKSIIESHNWLKLDSIVSSGFGISRDTVATSVAVAPLDPIHFNGTTWELASRTDEKYAWGIVVDTITSTEAIIQTVGFVTIPGHGKTVGALYSLGNGTAVLSSTIDSSMYDQWLWNVIDANTLDLKLSSHVQPPGSSVGGGGGSGSEVNNLSSIVTWTTVPDAYISASSVLQHVEDDVYGVSWNGDLGPATKNAIYDKIELISTGGEVNTASSVGSGTSIFKQKTGVDLEFNAIKSENALLSVALDATTNDVELTVQPALSNYTNDAGFITATLTQEQVEDYVGALLRDLGPITVTYDDAGDSLLISSVFSPGLTNHAVSGATHVINLGSYRDGIHQIDCTSASSPLTLTINNPIDQGVYTFHALNTSSTDIVYPANFFFMAGGGLVGTVSYTQDDGMTCYYDAANNKYYCK